MVLEETEYDVPSCSDTHEWLDMHVTSVAQLHLCRLTPRVQPGMDKDSAEITIIVLLAVSA